MTATKNQFFKPSKMSAQAKSEQATSVVKDILASEVQAREKKTERLKALRMSQIPADVENNRNPRRK